ncbi:TIGR03668 family PPOX class F420-dependent oxidoreductase [Haladaptatus pallidirubidus]|uniref:TIGR03668 family PPOX class F420-dependent oxidoreductase n=1 Tax=Haladaptatus pallidirubidus TaxID=1008152 RepID=A0AAV3UQY9_9EURY|nr:TIGR03668 family PPOX class F420-dependent oxidoreductase [Haladaptatus pallidirubidus]
MFDKEQRDYITHARIGRLATADSDGRPHSVPVCFALLDETIVTPIDEKPKKRSAVTLQRSRDINENPRVNLLIDHYTEDWSKLGWVQIRGTATHLLPSESDHAPAVTSLRQKYAQYATHALEERPIIRITPGSVLTWGNLTTL